MANQKLKEAKKDFKKLKKNSLAYNTSLNEVLTAFGSSPVPDWGGLVFNGQRMRT